MNVFLFFAAGIALAGSDNAQWVDPFIGTLANGHTTPAACRPFGMVQAGPDTGTGNWDHCSGYKDWDRAICGFSQTHLSGTGCSDLGDIRILPFSSGTVPAKCAFRKETETASPGAYAVTLHEEGVRVEATATEHVGVYRFTYGGNRARVLVDPQWGILSALHCLTTHVNRASVAAPRPDCVEGWIEARHWGGRYVAFTARFSKPAVNVEQLPFAPGEKAPKFVLDFSLGKDEPLLMKVALSATDVAHAGLNLETEMPGWDFDRCRADARAAWNEILSRMDIEGTEPQKKTAYTALYHLCTQPNNIADANGSTGNFGYPAQKPVPAPGRKCYTTFSFWDTFRAANPLYTIVTPEKVPEFVNSLVFRAEKAGFLPRWQLWGNDNGCMIGAHAVPLLVDAYLKGFPGDWERAYAIARKTLTTVVGWKKEKEDWPVLDRYGYYPFDLKKRESASSTMEAAYDDWCMARFAEAMGKKDDVAYFGRRAQGWTNLFDTATGFVRGRDSKGAWREPFDPLSAGHGKAKFRDFTEGNAYQYTFHVLQDPERLIGLCGGREKFVKKLDGIFSASARVVDAPPDMTGMVGQYSQGNEPSHHIAYFYALAGRSDRTAEIVRQIVDRYYTARRDGLCGNEDCGQMSAWYLFTAMGFYPFSPASGEYVLGAPQLPKVRVRMRGEGERWNVFTVVAKGLSKENKYVKRVTLNGNPVTDGKIRHADIVKGGELIFEMTDKPAIDNARWVDPYIGTAGGGNCFPGPSYPFGMAQPSPDTDGDVPRYGIPSGFRYGDPCIYGFSQTHLNGTGCADLGDVRLFPITGRELPPAKARPNGPLRDDAYRSTYAKSNAVCEVGYYSVRLDNGAFAEMTAAPHVAVSRFSWPDGKGKLLVDLQWGMVGNEKRLREHLMEHVSAPDPANCRILGTNKGWQWVYRETHYAIAFSQPWTSVEELPMLPREKAPRRVLTFDLKPGEKLCAKVAFSTVSPEKAVKNLEAEMPGWDFDCVRADCRAAWNDYLSRVEVEGSEVQKKTYYTGLYHLLLQPSDIADVDGQFRGIAREGAKFREKEVYDAPNGKFYSTFSLWDSFRAAAPYLTILASECVPDFLNSLLKQEEICGYLPIWPLWGGETGCMIANHAVPELADACLKGIGGVDWERAYAAAKRTLTRKRIGAMNTDWEQYAAFGYFPCDTKTWNVSRTLETAYDDAAMARFAAALGKTDDAAFFAKRARNCWNLWDDSIGFFRGKDSHGNWRTPFRTLAQGWWRAKDGTDYCEANAWQYLFHVMQDPDGLVAALGGRENFLRKLDAFFGDTRDLDGSPAERVHWMKLGQYEHGNEPSHHVAYFYALAGRPERTQELVRQIASRLYTTKPNGVPGNEDCGQTSAWYLFSALGFYPFDPCGGEYVLGAPQLPKVRVRVRGEGERWNVFTIVAKGLSKENRYVKRVTLNGKPVTDGKIRHADIMKGGELVFEMASDCRDAEWTTQRGNGHK